MKRSEFKKLTKLKKRNAKVVKMVTTTSLSIALIAPSILGSISVLAAEETVPAEQTVPTEQVETVHEAVQIVGNQAPIQAKAQSYTTTVNWVVNQNDANVSFDDGLTGTLSGTDNLYFATETSGFNTGLNGNQVGTQTFTFDSGLLGEEEGTSYTITLVVTDEDTAPAEKPKAPQSVSATDDGKFVYASGEQGTSVFVKDANRAIISSYTSANGVGTPVQIILNRALTKGEKVQVVAVNQMTDKQSDPTWFTFKAPIEVTNKVVGLDLATGAELYSYTEKGLEGATKEITARDVADYGLSIGETKVKTMTFGSNGDVTFYYTKKTTPPVTEKTTLTVKYVDIDTQTSVTTETVSEVESGKEIKLTAKTLTGYTLVGDNEVSVTPEGATQTVIFEYKKDADIPTPTEKTKLTVDFVDMETGKKVSESVVSEVEQGKETTVKAKDIKGFVLQGDATVKVTPTEANHTITFAYKKEIVNVVLDNATNVKFVEKSDGKQIIATVPKGLTLVIVKNGTVIGKSSNGLFARLLTDEVSINLDTRVAKGETVEYYTEDTEGNSSATANLTREGQEPVDPTEPTEPTNPTNPVDPTDPSTPKPVEPTNPTEPSTPNPVVPTTPSTTDTTKPVTKVDDKKENLIPQLGETSNLLSTIGMIISASMGFILIKRKK
ncbi:MucBP domain-containing protein [Carnobacterium maltaromaticum]|uniref:MucBP domain-containing protein n=1 Tax=Carnobacterium maltaromaticum TaxID=2751 RepID=UPI00295EB08A|nr:MucBP domain-containing protein [Carnobacterium maltaromaticum]